MQGTVVSVNPLVTWLDPQPAHGDVPAQMPSPFDHAVHPLARRAAAIVRAQIEASARAWRLHEGDGGKMFGVLVVEAADGRIGFLRGFSGMLDGRWHVDGFVPPVFDETARDAVWIDGEAEMRALAARIDALADGEEAREARASLDAIDSRHAAELTAMRERHAVNRDDRHAARARGVDDAAMHALAQASRADTAEMRRLEARHADERRDAAARVAAIDAERAALETARTARSRDLLVQIHDSYVLANGRGEARRLRDIFAPTAPPGGAGDCAAPKLLAYALHAALRPVALAEVWCGATPRTGDRHDGTFYPACRGKCGPVLGHMLDGVACEAAPVFGAAPISDDEPRVVYEDEWIVVVDKPCGLLSIPGRSGQLRDSVATRLRRRDPGATGALIVHRLDLDTSGLLLTARDPETHAALQAQFARREIEKRYVAWLDGQVAADRGTIDLPIRVDVDDRPRQIYDPVHGKPAVTAWEVLARDGDQTRVAFYPHTGRTHQLRVHAAHPRGLAAPIRGDRLYGRAAVPDGERLALHAEALAFTHPRTGARIALERPAPF
jgi:tRNA pseudouridine32 synthase / 23S rRNA pseudouridine746 synthase